ncbi:inosine-5'-monophosphate dehydrogenase [Methanobrevibacter cuticularis]|uniref:Inosine-5'-monophosphate dehydrogenase n=1 Tax=Methanobrevibacter cuticularis TaxID=47311 RepID=A0A166EAH6_9EURY|nr:CBS domain-containing protein [Methanobrevibacter cuticularis]KZX16448.1 inosine-5'-monophosphate dehydrogenase [Methanobrevibacter cuticularis]
MIKIDEAMKKDVITINKDDTITEAAKKLTENDISGAPVMDGDNIVGILSEGDIMDLLEVHSPNLNLILPSPLDLLEMPLRMKHEYDEVANGIKKASLTIVKDIMVSPVITIKIDKDIADAANIMADNNIKRIPVVDDTGNLIGIITRGDIVKALVNHKAE